ncbi:MAG: SHOCT domain-containing protein [Atopobiaceae bacterium]|jgi:hypothetical protein|nr:SHOCT domain-containing protein [Atopobiaceae bacterium]MCI2173778.1 SHOCT domain-containing protein [Atopobiaceae bacterium]MCI2207580.1 SHOCT domain-containing protein [Atopobiaceae bacterium]
MGIRDILGGTRGTGDGKGPEPDGASATNPLLKLIATSMLPNSYATEMMADQSRRASAGVEAAATTKAEEPTSDQAPSDAAADADEVVSKLKDLLDAGVLTQEEYEAKVRQVTGR